MVGVRRRGVPDSATMSRIAFLGMGVMGAPMARHLAKAGHEVVVYNRTAAKALAWVALNGNQAAPTPGEAAAGAEFVALCVGNDDDVREVVLGPTGALDSMGPGTVLVDHTTASAGLARELWWFPYNKRGLRLIQGLTEYQQETGIKRLWAGIRAFFRRRTR